jgi:serine/threonine protein kinase
VIHKDVKPDNLIVTDDGIRLVDLGLMTPVESALTLTTHGTEYFRDPEMVKLAVAGKRVRDVDAARFDVYSSGAVMYLLLEGSFPACGPLSRFSRPVPMALRTITSRAMAEGTKRYASIAAMRTDLEAFRRMLADREPDDIPATALPSLAGGDVEDLEEVPGEDVLELEEVTVPEPRPAPPPIAAAPPPVAEPEPERDEKSRVGAGTYVAVMLGLVLALFGFLYLLLQSGSSDPANARSYPTRSRSSQVSETGVAETIAREIADHRRRAGTRGEIVPDRPRVIVVARDGLQAFEQGVRRRIPRHGLIDYRRTRLCLSLRRYLAENEVDHTAVRVEAMLRAHEEPEPLPVVATITGDPESMLTVTVYLPGEALPRTANLMAIGGGGAIPR